MAHERHQASADPIAIGYLLSFASGATALIYEVLWMRRFLSLFGATAPAVSATLSAIFIGLGAGSAVIGSRCGRIRRPLRAYGVLEIGVGITAAFVPPLVGFYDRLFPWLYSTFTGHHAVFVTVKTMLAIIALFLPAFLMGGTIALLAQAFISSSRRLGTTGSGLYGANTLGATAGTLSVPFLVLPWLGVQWGYYCTVAASLLIGGLSCWIDRRLAGGGFELQNQQRDAVRRTMQVHGKNRAPERSTELMPQWTLAAMAFLSGLLTLALEVLWTRMLAQIHENSIYSFAVVLSVFLVGLAGGAFLARLILRFGNSARVSLGAAWIGAGILVFASPGLFYFLTDGLSYVSEFGRFSELTTLLFAAATMLLPTLLAGMILPLLLQISTYREAGPPGRILGKLLAQNTAGAVVGPLLVTYILFSGPGLWMSIAAMGLLMAFVGDLVLNKLPAAASAPVRRMALAALFGIVAIVSNPAVLPRVKIKRDGNEQLIHLEEGPHSIVAVLESPTARSMILNNFYTLGGTASALEERQQAHIPLFLHPAPRRVAFLGLGTGITAGGALLPGVEKVVAIEMVPEVTRTAAKYFAAENVRVLSDPRVEVVNEDARVYLKAGAQTFDVIIGDLIVPWRSGESSLFTREHFETARRALAPGGLFCQWLPMYQLTNEQFRIIAATFLDIFPQTTIWRGDLLPKVPALALIGHTSDAPIDAGAVDRRVQQLRPWCVQRSPILSTSGGIWLFLVGSIHAADPEYVRARRNLESAPWIELLSPLIQLRGGSRGPSAFTGEALFDFMEQTRLAPLQGSVLANLDAQHLGWRDAGATLWQASLLLHQGHEDLANQRAAEALAAVPSELRTVINGE